MSIRFEKGTVDCQMCGTYKDIIQFETDMKIKELPITNVRFLCKECAINIGLIKS